MLYTKLGGPYEDIFSSKGNLAESRKWVRTLHGDLRPVGLFIPFRTAWPAVKEFIETDGKLPRSIEWIANRNLPPARFRTHGSMPKWHEGALDCRLRVE